MSYATDIKSMADVAEKKKQPCILTLVIDCESDTEFRLIIQALRATLKEIGVEKENFKIKKEKIKRP